MLKGGLTAAQLGDIVRAGWYLKEVEDEDEGEDTEDKGNGCEEKKFLWLKQPEQEKEDTIM